jgi:hypothetical protein
MGESRDAVKAATEIGVIMMGRPVQNNHRHSVIAVTFRGSRPRVAIGMAGPLAPALRRHRNLRRSGGYACLQGRTSRPSPLCFWKPFAASQTWLACSLRAAQRSAASMDQQQASRRLAESRRLLTEGGARIRRQRAIIARLEQLRIDCAKQRALLTRMLEAQDQEAKRAAELLDWLQANPGPSPAQ